MRQEGRQHYHHQKQNNSMQCGSTQPYKLHNFRSISEGEDSPIVNQDSATAWQYSGKRVVKFYLYHPSEACHFYDRITMCLFAYHCMLSA